MSKDQLQNHLIFWLQNTLSFKGFRKQFRSSYFVTIPKSINLIVIIRVCMMIGMCIFFIGCIPKDKEHRGLTHHFYDIAFTMEQKNELVDAKKNYQLAVAADPSNNMAQQALKKIHKKLQTLADRQYQKSIMLTKKGKYNQATQSLLIALRLQPEHEAARQALMKSQNQNFQRYVRHIVKKGETLSKISKTYYGNFKLSSVIARVNNIKDAGRIRLGMKLKIPEVKDHPFVNQTEKVSHVHMADDPVQPEKKTNSLMMYKSLGMDLYKEQQFDNAIIEFKKVLSADPDEKDSMVYISKAYYQLGSTAYVQKDFLTAIDHFQNALTFNKACSRCKNRMMQSRNTYKESHYKAGMKFFNQENLNQAISEWELVQKMDPDYKKVTKLLKKARTIQTNINIIKTSD